MCPSCQERSAPCRSQRSPTSSRRTHVAAFGRGVVDVHSRKGTKLACQGPVGARIPEYVRVWSCVTVTVDAERAFEMKTTGVTITRATVTTRTFMGTRFLRLTNKECELERARALKRWNMSSSWWSCLRRKRVPRCGPQLGVGTGLKPARCSRGVRPGRR